VKLAETAVVNAVAFQGFLRPYRGWNIWILNQGLKTSTLLENGNFLHETER
jgi:hypothetical protein